MGDRVQGRVVGIPLIERVMLVEIVRVTEPDGDRVQGRVVGMPLIERLTVVDRVRVTEPL